MIKTNKTEAGGIRLGDYTTLTVVRRADHGIYLAPSPQTDGERGAVEQTGDILLPNRYIPVGTNIGDEIEVFIYLDHDERIIATTERPLATVGQFACLEVAWINKYGAFLNWGLQKDLFCPFREQKQRMEKGKHYIVYVKEDEASHRLMATGKVEKYLQRAEEGIHGTPVDCLVWQKTDLGFKVIIDNRYQGQIYDNQIFQPLHSGDRLTAYVDHVREDGKIDITLQPTGRQHTLDFAEVLLRYLYENNGHCELDDHSPAELIADRFKVSKKAYKKAIGDLYRRRLITIDTNGINLVK